jgi:DNA-binding transcriptional regulator YiaG
MGWVALLGIAGRSIQVNYPSKLSQLKQSKVLKSNVKTLGDWLKIKRLEKNLTPGHVAAKMGIAASLVCSWEKEALFKRTARRLRAG